MTNTDQADALKPCPNIWCKKSRPEMMSNGLRCNLFVRCASCGISAPHSKHRCEAIKNWNARAPEPEGARLTAKCACGHSNLEHGPHGCEGSYVMPPSNPRCKCVGFKPASTAQPEAERAGEADLRALDALIALALHPETTNETVERVAEMVRQPTAGSGDGEGGHK